MLCSKTSGSPLGIKGKLREYLVYLVIVGVIFSFLILRRDYLLAPPYAVSAYLVVFQRKSVSRRTLTASYLMVVLTADLIHLTLGPSIAGMVVNVVVISAFITFSEMTHPPAIALVIFSYIAHNLADFTVSTLMVLVVLVASSYILDISGILK